MKQNDSRNIQRSTFRKCNVVKMTMLPKFINKFNAISIKILTGIIFKELHLLSLKIYFVRQRSWNGQNKGGRLALPDFKTYYKATEIKTV